VIQQQMEETRSSLQDKLETLELQVKNTVQEATEAVAETVESVKEAVHETVETVKDTVQDTVQSVRQTFDLSQHVQDHPVAAFLGATAVGFIATRWLMSFEKTGTSKAPLRPAPAFTPPPPLQRNGGHAKSSTAAQASKEGWLSKHYSKELSKIKGLAVGAVGGVVRDLLTSSVPPNMAEQIKEVVDGFTEKLGGQVIEGSILPAASERASGQTAEGKNGGSAEKKPYIPSQVSQRGGINLQE